MKKISAEQQEWFLFAIVLMIGAVLMLIAGQFALRMPRSWQISDTNMDSKLNPNEVYAVYRKDYDFRLAPIRTDIPNLLATVANATVNPGSVLPPPAVEFNAPAQIATTTPFPWSSATASANTPQTSDASATSLPAASETPPLPTATLEWTATPLPTITPRRTATRTRTPIPTPRPTSTNAPTSAPQPSATHTSTATPAPSSTHTATNTPVDTATATLTPTATATATATFTATSTSLPSNCLSTGPNTFPDPVTYTVPVGGCTISYSTTAQGAILSLDITGSGNVSINWFGLLENQASGTCADQSSNLTPGKSLTNIAVAKTTTASIVVNNPTSKTNTVQVTISDWLVGGCQ